MKQVLGFFMLLAVSTLGLQAQPLYMPRDVAQAFTKGTRQADGRPGPAYWQNNARYTINLFAAPPDRNVRGNEEIVYTNNSPDTLRQLVIKLILNIHKPGARRYDDAVADYLTGGMTVDTCKIRGRKVPFAAHPDHLTWQGIELDQPLLPHDSIVLHFDWHFQPSLVSNREGMTDSTTYYLAYFYPRVAVYDDCNGWDKIPFTDLQEFYNDFNDYTLQVTVPKNYIVWATGDLQNSAEVLKPAYAERLARSLQSDENIHIATFNELRAGTVTAQSATNTWTWKASHVSDMALCLSDHFVWDASSVVADAQSGRRVSVQSAYNDTAQDFHYMVGFAKHAVSWLSQHWPGIPYPYTKTTVCQGFADMEYPMMVNDNASSDTNFARFVAEHEIAHTWFPFYMGINEQRYAFMDEGIATMLELLIGRADMGKPVADSLFQKFRVNYWIHDSRAIEDLPIITPANVFGNTDAYGNNAYGKPALGYLALMDLLGEDLFKKCLHEYMERWNGKHPLPWDFFNSFNNTSRQDLNWFWNNWFFGHGYIDMAIEKVEKGRQDYTLSINNKGGYPAPFDISIIYTDGTTTTLHQTPALWQQTRQALVKIPAVKAIRKITIAGGIFMDADERNNQWEVK